MGLDFSADLLRVAAARQAAAPLPWRRAPLEWVNGDALQLPFDDGSFDAVTMGYGLRNVANIPAALSELRRVLRPGRGAAILDFHQPTSPLAAGFQAAFLDGVVVPVARAAGLSAEYEYLKARVACLPFPALGQGGETGAEAVILSPTNRLPTSAPCLLPPPLPQPSVARFPNGEFCFSSPLSGVAAECRSLKSKIFLALTSPRFCFAKHRPHAVPASARRRVFAGGAL